MRKILSTLTAFAILATFAPVSAAWLNGANLSWVASWTATASTITVTAPAWTFASTTTATATITDLDWTATANATTLSYTSNDADTQIVFTTAVGALTNNASYVVSFVTDDNVFGSFVLAVWTPTDNKVNVSAVVPPTLSMSLSTNTMALWTLTSSAYAQAATTVTTSTNANAWVTVVMASAWLASSVKEIWVTSIHANAATTWTDYYKVTTNGTPALSDWGVDITTGAGDDMEASQTVYSAAGPISAAATTVTVGAKISDTTEAWSYTDTLTFTATASF